MLADDAAAPRRDLRGDDHRSAHAARGPESRSAPRVCDRLLP
jgi:hypothetical protein